VRRAHLYLRNDAWCAFRAGRELSRSEQWMYYARDWRAAGAATHTVGNCVRNARACRRKYWKFISEIVRKDHA